MRTRHRQCPWPPSWLWLLHPGRKGHPPPCSPCGPRRQTIAHFWMKIRLGTSACRGIPRTTSGPLTPAIQRSARVDAHPSTDAAESACRITHCCGVFRPVCAYYFTLDALGPFSSLPMHDTRANLSVSFTSVPESEIWGLGNATQDSGKVRVVYSAPTSLTFQLQEIGLRRQALFCPMRQRGVHTRKVRAPAIP
jgi:hypothetical protein